MSARDELRRALGETPIPDEQEAERRAWRMVSAAFDGEPATARRGGIRSRLRPLSAIAATLVALAVAATPPGAALADWLAGVVNPSGPPARPALTSLPADGRLLVDTATGPWVVARDGSKRRLGRYSDAVWSPRGLFVVAARGRQLVALEPDGTVRWALARAAPIADPAWSPDGFRIAYRSGGQLRVVVADGTADKALAPIRAGSAPAWRPGSAHVLAYVDSAGRTTVVDADTRRTLWRTPASARPVRLLWTADGRRLIVVSAREVRVLDAAGRPLDAVQVPAGARAGDAAVSPRGSELAVVRSRPAGRSEIVAYRIGPRLRPARRLFAGSGGFEGLTWSPDGRWLLAGWPAADQWIFIRSTAVTRLVAISNVGRQFDPGGNGAARFPRIAGWCCAPPRAEPAAIPVADAERCSPTPATRPSPDVALALDADPIYAVMGFDPARGPLSLRTNGPPGIDGRYAVKVLWAVAPRYRGRVLIRDRSNGAGRLGFSAVSSPSGRPSTSHSTLPRGGRPGWRYFPSAIFLREPGCYSFGVTGAGREQTVTFRVAR
jgi:Tol biopolymer transport system component